MNVSAYWQLARFDKPTGSVLLLAPTLWALWIANNGLPPVALVLWFCLGTLLMRAAGCVMNDIADRNIDRHVTRTQHRPLTAGVVTVTQSALFLMILLLLALLVLLQLPWRCFFIALPALAITIIYPFCKRFFRAPQFVLGMAF